MSPIKKLPNSVRYTRGKFRHLGSPLFWGPLGIVCFMLVFVWTLSLHPEWLQIEDEEFDDRTTIEGISPEASAIAADIDSSVFLLKELEFNAQAQNQAPILSGKDLLEEYRQRNRDRNSQFEESTREIYSIYEEATKNQNYPNFPGDNSTNNSLLNLDFSTDIGSDSSERNLNQGLSNQGLNSHSNFNEFSRQNQQQDSQKSISALQAAMEDYLNSEKESDSSLNGYQKIDNSSLKLHQTDNFTDNEISLPGANYPTENYPFPSDFSNNNSPYSSNPRTTVNSEEDPYYINPSPTGEKSAREIERFGNTTPTNQPYYTGTYGNPTTTVPTNQPYYIDRSGSGYVSPTQPITPAVPSASPMNPNNFSPPSNPYSGSGINRGINPYSGSGVGQNQFTQPNTTVNPYQGNPGYSQNQPYNNFDRPNPFNSNRQ